MRIIIYTLAISRKDYITIPNLAIATFLLDLATFMNAVLKHTQKQLCLETEKKGWNFLIIPIRCCRNDCQIGMPNFTLFILSKVGSRSREYLHLAQMVFPS